MYITVLIKIIVYGNGTAKTILKMDELFIEYFGGSNRLKRQSVIIG